MHLYLVKRLLKGLKNHFKDYTFLNAIVYSRYSLLPFVFPNNEPLQTTQPFIFHKKQTDTIRTAELLETMCCSPLGAKLWFWSLFPEEGGKRSRSLCVNKAGGFVMVCEDGCDSEASDNLCGNGPVRSLHAVQHQRDGRTGWITTMQPWLRGSGAHLPGQDSKRWRKLHKVGWRTGPQSVTCCNRFLKPETSRQISGRINLSFTSAFKHQPENPAYTKGQAWTC